VRAVADTDTVVSGLLWTGAPRALLIAARAGKLSLYTSATLLDELFDVLTRAKFTKRVTASNMSVERLVRRNAQFAQRVIPASIDPVILADPDDDQVLACAIAARADLIISGDRHLRDIQSHQGIRIVSTGEALRLITQ
jgi:putative PIN family toxin of toxin-antitoxin system